jgi:hypothetical protein
MHTDFTQYIPKPHAMVAYLRYNGPHFNEALCDFAVRKMKKEDASGELKRITPWKKEEVETMLTEAGVKLDNDDIYDAVYVANMCKADYFGSSIEDKKHVAKYIKDTLDDEDAADGEVFECFLAKCDKRGVHIDWEDML